MAVWAHEISHAIYGFGDLYKGGINATAEPRSYALMGNGYGNTGNRGAFMSVANRLRLGWMTPRLVTRSGTYTIEEAKRGGKALILPRLDCNGQGSGEYFAIENRRNEDDAAPMFDRKQAETGFHIWHFVPDQDRDLAPWCDDPNWDQLKSDNKQHRFITMGNLCAGPRAWPDGAPDLLDKLENPMCRPQDWQDCTDANQAGDRVLTWADGTRSGFNLTNFRSAAGTKMSVDIIAPSCELRPCDGINPLLSCQCDAGCVRREDCCFDKALYCG